MEEKKQYDAPIDLKQDSGTGRKIFIEAKVDGDKEYVYSDWLPEAKGGFRNHGEVIQILVRVIQSIEQQLQNIQLQQRPFTGTPPWVGRKNN